VDGNLLGSDPTSPYSVNWDTTKFTEGDRRLEAVAIDNSGNVATTASMAYVQNAGAKFLQRVTEATRNGSVLTLKYELTNQSASNASDVKLNNFWVEGTGSFPGIKKLYCTQGGNPLPINLGTVNSGQTVQLILRCTVPTDVTSTRRWVSRGQATIGSTVYDF